MSEQLTWLCVLAETQLPALLGPAQPLVIPVPRILTSSSGLHGHCTHSTTPPHTYMLGHIVKIKVLEVDPLKVGP